jgi:hypothetical protein
MYPRILDWTAAERFGADKTARLHVLPRLASGFYRDNWRRTSTKGRDWRPEERVEPSLRQLAAPNAGPAGAVEKAAVQRRRLAEVGQADRPILLAFFNGQTIPMIAVELQINEKRVRLVVKASCVRESRRAVR